MNVTASSSSSLASLASGGVSSAIDETEQLKRSALDKLVTTAASTGSRRLDRVVNLGSNIVEKATKMKIINLNDETVPPLDKTFLDFIMDVCALV